MYINLAGTWLTNPNDGTSERSITSAREFVLNGKIISQVENPIGAIAAALFARGNLTHSITFKVTRRFTTIAAAYAFALTHRSLLPTSGELIWICGWPNEGQIRCRSGNAILEDCNWDSTDTPGVSITHSYAITCEDITQLPPAGPIKASTGSNILASTGSPLESN